MQKGRWDEKKGEGVGGNAGRKRRGERGSEEWL